MSNVDAAGNLHDPQGQFAGRISGEQPDTLSLHSVPTPKTWMQERYEQFENGHYVAAIATGTRVDPHDAGDAESRKRWWRQSFTNAEYGNADGDYATMPEDYTPSRTLGAAESGKDDTHHRRTHRMLYEGGGTAIRMPSKASVRRFAAEQKGRTFDVPMSMTTPGGRSVTGMVRVTPGANGTWHTEALGFNDHDAVYASEGVSAVLESRRARTALMSAGDLRERHEERKKSEGLQMAKLRSSWIDSGGYDSDTGYMVMAARPRYRKRDGVTVPKTYYGYVGVTPEEYSDLRTGGGTHFQAIKGKKTRHDPQVCTRCGRPVFDISSHVCTEQSVRSADALNDKKRGIAARVMKSRWGRKRRG